MEAVMSDPINPKVKGPNVVTYPLSVLDDPTEDRPTVITTTRASVQSYPTGHIIVMIGDGPTPTHIIDFANETVAEDTLNELMAQLREIQGRAK
jgi:hypothetical protein